MSKETLKAFNWILEASDAERRELNKQFIEAYHLQNYQIFSPEQAADGSAGTGFVIDNIKYSLLKNGTLVARVSYKCQAGKDDGDYLMLLFGAFLALEGDPASEPAEVARMLNCEFPRHMSKDLLSWNGEDAWTADNLLAVILARLANTPKKSLLEKVRVELAFTGDDVFTVSNAEQYLSASEDFLSSS